MRRSWRSAWGQSGQGLIEYALILELVAVLAIIASTGQSVMNSIQAVVSGIQSVVGH